MFQIPKIKRKVLGLLIIRVGFLGCDAMQFAKKVSAFLGKLLLLSVE